MESENKMNRHELHHGDNRAVLKTMADNSVDSIVCDPPYELGFMGSGSTGCAAMLEGMRFVGIDITAEYVDIAERRIQHYLNQNPMEL